MFTCLQIKVDPIMSLKQMAAVYFLPHYFILGKNSFQVSLATVVIVDIFTNIKP